MQNFKREVGAVLAASLNQAQLHAQQQLVRELQLVREVEVRRASTEVRAAPSKSRSRRSAV